jgi:predicted metal-dependent HD superfamily phosphohydrolase
VSDPAAIARLRARWDAVVAPLGGGDGRVFFEGIVRSYSEPHRAYHTLGHLDYLFDRLDEHAGDAADKQRLAFAAWYHDVIYDPRAGDNEERSALRAIDELTRLGGPTPLIERVALLIRVTAAHTKGGTDHDDNLFLDADFCILGAQPEAYRRYVAGVRHEYAHVDDAGWRAGRGAFLTNALKQTRIFHTDRVEAAYGPQARANMTSELTDLTQS